MDAGEPLEKKIKLSVLNKGQKYEKNIYNLLVEKGVKMPINLAGNDAGFNNKGVDYYIEIKNKNAPDFGQKGLVWNKDDKWTWRENDSISQMFDEIKVIAHIDTGFEPRRYIKSLKEITSIDKSYDQKAFRKSKIPLPVVTYLYDFYARRKCYYIQIEDKGFYYLQKDIANLGVPQFKPDLTLRLRAKTHTSMPIYNYSFFAVIQANKRSVGITNFDLEEKSGRKFPPIEFIIK